MSLRPEPTTKGLWRWRTDLMVVALYVAMAALVTGRLWRDPTGRASGVNASDPTLFEWMLAHAARSVTHLENPLLSTRMSTPSGLNIMANTSILGLGIPLTPITVVWGPSVSYLIVITFGLAATAAAWYFVLSRHVTQSRLAASVGAAFCAFCPGMLSQAGGHPHILVQFLVPLIIWRVLRLRETIRPVRDGLVLGVLIAAQVFIGEEILFITAMVCAVCVAGYCVFRGADARRSWRPFLTGLGVAALLALLLVAYPLFVQLFGPQHYRHVPQIDTYGADLLSCVAYSPLTIGGDPTAEIHLARNHTELNAFFGYPLLVLIVAAMWWQRRHLAVRLAAVVAVVFGLLSLGHDILIDGKYTGIPGPWRLFARQPLFESVVTTRFALVVAAAIGVTLSVAIEQILRINQRRTLTLLASGACLVVALAPLTPRQLPATTAMQVPDALAGGAWRRYVNGDEAVMPVPPTREATVALMSWSARERLGFRVTHGYFLGPKPGSDGWATFSTPTTATDRLLIRVNRTGEPAVITDATRRRAQADLAFRETGLMVMSIHQPNADVIRATVDALVGPGQHVGDVWLWDLHGD
jgi:hypothetical protein